MIINFYNNHYTFNTVKTMNVNHEEQSDSMTKGMNRVNGVMHY